ncbi:TetR family transcriptional regulator C-terminal domain-containing protein [Yoonia sp.]|uniref:TetR family transcriptional regulator C-terminal domain-containing protein n=1 Tax=Yoonia sp. TaxID=2212373 RepID=UPI0025FB08B2|nr:TetR family transcriptional regulator C-terminal domain-containing protein [Yoonia sp.]
MSEVFRDKIAACFAAIAARVAVCLEEARMRHDIPGDSNLRDMADLLVDFWEGAALRSRLQRSPDSLDAMLDFYFDALAANRQNRDTPAAA